MVALEQKIQHLQRYICEGPEWVKWELGFGQMFTKKMGFGSLELEITDK